MNPLLALKRIFPGRSLLFGAFAAFIIGVFCLGLWRFHVGFLLGWDPRGSADLHERFVEYGYFLFGVYPSPGIAGDHALQGMRNSVYPPHAFPMLSLFFWDWKLAAGKSGRCAYCRSLSFAHELAWFPQASWFWDSGSAYGFDPPFCNDQYHRSIGVGVIRFLFDRHGFAADAFP